MGYFRNVLLLMWKNWILQKRKKCVTIFEFLIPAAVIAIIILMRHLIDLEVHSEPKEFKRRNVLNGRSGYFDYGKCEIYYTPACPVVNKIMESVQDQLYEPEPPMDTFELKGFRTVPKMLERYRTSFAGRPPIALQFTDVDCGAAILPESSRLILMPAAESDTKYYTKETFTDDYRPKFYKHGYDFRVTQMLVLVYKAVARHWQLYETEQGILRNFSFSATGDARNRVERQAGAGKDLPKWELYTQQMPYPPFEKDPMTDNFHLLGLLLQTAFMVSVLVFTEAIVLEKKQKLKESMKLMGLGPRAYWSSWFLTFSVYMLIIVIVFSAVVLGVKFVRFTDPFLFFTWVLLYGITVITFCFAVSVFLQNANLAAVMALIFQVLTIPAYFSLNRTQKMLCSLLFGSAFTFGAQALSEYEFPGNGANWSNFTKLPTPDSDFTLWDSMFMLAVDSCLNLVITWYMDNVYPGEFGMPKPLYFPFSKSYWCPKLVHPSSSVAQSDSNNPKYFEKDPMLEPGIAIKNIRKKFRGEKVAVEGMSLNMYTNQITVLLGHNGAGKTTTMSMLTGFFPPTSGTAVVNGYDIRTQIDSVHKSLGLCPQHNVLFDLLTVEEHLYFFAKMKCFQGNVKQEIAAAIQETGLVGSEKTLAQNLSGGQKRKLSVAIALIAGSQVVILDEPTSGMDPGARRQIWDVLQRKKEGRTILLTTHYMEEADILGDRIAIMNEGVVKCCGTSMFLKKLYGAGYHLIIVKGPSCNVPAITETVLDSIPNSEYEEEIGSELVYRLPDDQTALFPSLFNDLERRKESLKITGFGIKATTMEEVFLRVGEIAVEEDEEETNDVTITMEGASANVNAPLTGSQQNTLDFNHGFVKLTGVSLFLHQLMGLLMKKALYAWRRKFMTFLQIFLLAAMIALALLIDWTSSRAVSEYLSPADEIKLDYNLSAFTDPKVVVSNGFPSNQESTRLAREYASLAKDNGASVLYLQRPMTDSIEKGEGKTFGNITDFFVEEANEAGFIKYDRQYPIGADFQPFQAQTMQGIKPTMEVTAWFSGSGIHSEAISIIYAMNTYIKAYAGTKYDLQASLLPLPPTVEESSTDTYPNYRDADQYQAHKISILIVPFATIGIAFLLSSFVGPIIKERQLGVKHLQMLSGVNLVLYWVSTFVWDFATYLVAVLLIIPVSCAYGIFAFVQFNAWIVIIFVFEVYGFAAILFTYVLQHIFSGPVKGLTIMFAFYCVGTWILSFAVSVFTALMQDVATVKVVFECIFPPYNFIQILDNTFKYYFKQRQCSSLNLPTYCVNDPYHSCCQSCVNDKWRFCVNNVPHLLAWELPGLSFFVLCSVIQFFVSCGIILAIELGIPVKVWEFIKGCFTRSRGDDVPLIQNPLDDDVAQEKNRITHTPLNDLFLTDSLIFKDLSKKYGYLVAVEKLCVGVPAQECFGLLGQNGAGKTTTFKMLTGLELATSGNAYIMRNDINQNIKLAQSNMGYCPQFDALSNSLTGRETLRLYSKIKGIPNSDIERVCNSLMELLMLHQDADKLVKKYSGGNRRKLSTAVALIGDPAFILLDEPSSGMDPKARRQLWNVLSKVRASGRTLVLTSHSMEECDALCTRLAIMVNGEFVCLGSPQHLKNKFGQGYTLIAQMETLSYGTSVPSDPVVNYIKQHIPSAKVFDDHQGYLHIQVPDMTVSLADIFSMMENSKLTLHVRDYSVHQTTLEQVFLSFAKKQINPERLKSRAKVKRQGLVINPPSGQNPGGQHAAITYV